LSTQCCDERKEKRYRVNRRGAYWGKRKKKKGKNCYSFNFNTIGGESEPLK
jgi:hypothetical protein